MGVWALESRTINCEVVTKRDEVMTIEEDAIETDSLATGHYVFGANPEERPMTLELKADENILEKEVIFTCTNKFHNADSFELIDLFDMDSTVVVTTWLRQ